MISGATRIECPETWERFNKIIETIDIVDPGQKRERSNYRFLKQEVISFYSVQGGTGKTSLVFNTAWSLKEKDMGRILIIDLNFCEGPSDLTINLNAGGYCNMGDFIDGVLEGDGNIGKNVFSIEGIDILCPPLSLYQSDRLSVDLLNSLIYSARNEYDLIMADLPFRYDNISLEMMNISTTSVLVISPDIRLIPRMKSFRKFLPGNQKKMAIINKAEDLDAVLLDEFEDIIDMDICTSIPFIPATKREYIKANGEMTGIIDLQSGIDDLINRLF
jgi:cellulose biosynthesis protein BcsQ